MCITLSDENIGVAIFLGLQMWTVNKIYKDELGFLSVSVFVLFLIERKCVCFVKQHMNLPISFCGICKTLASRILALGEEMT